MANSRHNPTNSLDSKDIENLFMARRCHSATHIAFGGTRKVRPDTCDAVASQNGDAEYVVLRIYRAGR